MPHSFRNNNNHANEASDTNNTGGVTVLGPDSSDLSYAEFMHGELMLLDGQRYLPEKPGKKPAAARADSGGTGADRKVEIRGFS